MQSCCFGFEQHRGRWAVFSAAFHHAERAPRVTSSLTAESPTIRSFKTSLVSIQGFSPPVSCAQGRLVNEMHAYKVHAHETHARGMHAYEMHPMKYIPMRCTPIRHKPLRCTPMRHMPMRCAPVRCTLMRCTPVRYTPMRYTPERFGGK